MSIIRNSLFYHIFTLVASWFSRQWEQSRVVTWLTGLSLEQPKGLSLSLEKKLHGFLCRGFEKLHLDRLLFGSIFLHPALYAAFAVILAPLLPTLMIFALVCAGFLSLFLLYGTRRDMLLDYNPIRRYVMLYAGIYLYATLTSTTLSGSLFPGLLTIAFVLFFLVLTSCGMSQKHLIRLVSAVVAVGVLVSLYGFYQWLNPAAFRNVWTDTDMFSTVVFRVYSTLENPNVLGEYFLLIIPLGFALSLNARSWPKRLLALAACGIMVLCLVLTYSRGCYLGLLFAVAVFLVLLDSRLIVVGIAAILLSPLYLPESVLTRFASIGDMGDTSTSYRVYIWMGTLAMLKDYWLCGIGPGNEAFNTVYPRYAYNAITAPHSHNLFLQIACDTGIAGIVVFLLLLIAYYRMMFTAIRRETNRSARFFQIACVSAISGFLVESMTDYTFYNYRVLLLFWVVLALSVLFAKWSHNEKKEETSL